MAKKIVWTKRASTKFSKIINYLEDEWGTNPTKTLPKGLLILVNCWQRNLNGTLENREKNIRGFFLTKHNRLFYRITKKEMILLNFFDTRTGRTEKH